MLRPSLPGAKLPVSSVFPPHPSVILSPRVHWGRESPGPSAVARPKRHSGPFADSSYDLGQGLLSCKMGGDSPGMRGQRKLDFQVVFGGGGGREVILFVCF